MNAENNPALLWAQTYLNEKGYSLQGSFVPVQMSSWARVYRVITTKGLFYLKQIPEPFAIEPKLLLYLRSFFPALVPEVLGNNPSLRCFLMSDRGMSLRNYFEINYQPELAKEALKSYALIQRSLASQIDSLLALGVPDWRLDKLPGLYLTLMNEKEFLKNEGLTQNELDLLDALQPKFVRLCQKLASYLIPETIEHSDFHENNVLYQAHHLTINDWGESVISHPFFSLISFLSTTMRHHQINETSGIYGILCDGYLSQWEAYASQDTLLNAFELAKRISPIKYCLSFYRLTQCPGWYAIERHQGRIAQVLRTFLNSATTADEP